MGGNYKLEISSELPQNNPEGTEMTREGNRYGEQALFMYFIINFYDILKVVFISGLSHGSPDQVYSHKLVFAKVVCIVS